MMKTIYRLIFTLPFLVFANFSPAQEVNAARWDSFCKHNIDKCETADRICEMYENTSCDEIRLAFVLNRPFASQQKEEVIVPEEETEQ